MHEFPTTIHSVTRVIYEMLKENTTTFINGPRQRVHYSRVLATVHML